MVKTAKEMIDYLKTLPEESPILVVWFEKNEAEMHLGKEITDKQFRKIGNKFNDEFCDAEFVEAMWKSGLAE